MPALVRNLPVESAKCKKMVAKLNMTRRTKHDKNLVIMGLYLVPNFIIFIQRRRKT